MASPGPRARDRKSRRARYSGSFRIRDLHALGLIAAVVVVLAVWGVFWGCESEQCSAEGIGAKAVKLLAILPGFSPKGQGAAAGANPVPIQLTLAQYLLSLLVLFGALRVFTLNLRRDIRVQFAKLRRGHVIICGLGETGREIAENLRYEPGGIVAIALDHDEPNAIALDQLKVPILKGDATQFGMLGLAGLRNARGVVVTTGSDAINIEVALRVEAELAACRSRLWSRPGVGRPLFVLPEVRSAWLIDLLHTYPTTTLGAEGIETRPFDLYASAARQLLGAAPFRRNLPPGKQPHLLLAGLGEMGTQIIVHAVCANYALPGCRLAVTVLDQQGEAAAAGLAVRFPGLRDLIDLDFVQAAFDADNAATWHDAWEPVDAVLGRPDDGRVTVAAIASLGDDTDSLHTALQLRRRLDRLGRVGTPVFVRGRQQRALGDFAAQLDGTNALVHRLVPFGDLASLTNPARLIGESEDRLARALHDAYLAGRKSGDRPSPAAVSWRQLPERFKQSNRAVADHLSAKLALVGMRAIVREGKPAAFTDAEIDTMAVAEHERWWIEHKVAGWTCGPRDDLRLVHPDMVPWGELGEGQREYDRTMVRAIRDNLASIGQTIRRERIITAFGNGLAGAEAALAAIRADEVAIVVLDPDEAGSWAFAQRAAAQSAVLWVLWREGRIGAPVAPSEVPAAVRGAVEATVSMEELAGLLP